MPSLGHKMGLGVLPSSHQNHCHHIQDQNVHIHHDKNVHIHDKNVHIQDQHVHIHDKNDHIQDQMITFVINIILPVITLIAS